MTKRKISKKRRNRKRKTHKKQKLEKKLYNSFKSINNYISDNLHKGEKESYVDYYQRFSNGENVFTYFYVLKKLNSEITDNLCIPDNKLYYDYDKHSFTNKPLNKYYSIFHLTIFLIYDLKKIIAPNNFKKSILDCNDRFILISCNIQWGVKEWTGAHQTILLFDNKKKTVELFDPEYTYKDDIEYDDVVSKFINKHFKNKYKYLGTYFTTHPDKKYGPQMSVDEFSGLCTAWSIMYTQLRIMNPNIKQFDITKQMMEGDRKKRKEVLLKFTKKIKSTIKDNIDVITTEIV